MLCQYRIVISVFVQSVVLCMYPSLCKITEYNAALFVKNIDNHTLYNLVYICIRLTTCTCMYKFLNMYISHQTPITVPDICISIRINIRIIALCTVLGYRFGIAYIVVISNEVASVKEL